MVRVGVAIASNRWWVAAALLALLVVGGEFWFLAKSREGFRAELAAAARTGPKAVAGESTARASMPVLPPLEHFSDLTERPPFVPSRRPAPRASESTVPRAEEVGPSKRWKLVGIVVAPDHTQAVLRERRGARSVTVSVGMSLAGWVVSAVDAESVQFKAGDRLVSLELHPPQEEANAPNEQHRSQFRRGGAFKPR